MSQIMELEQEMFALLKQREEALIKIRESDRPLIEKWQSFLTVVLPIQVMAIRKHGYAGNQQGLAEYTKQLSINREKDPQLKKISHDKWLYLFKQAFGFSEVKTMSLEEAQKLTREITQVMTAEPFLQEIDKVISEFPETAMVERQKALLNLILPAQMKVMEEHGFSGDEGYIQAQRAMMDYFFDSVVMEEAQKAQEAILKRAKLMG